MKIYCLHKWSVQVSPSNPYQAPEVSGIRLVGYRDDETEHRVITSPVVEINGKNITTQSGSVYTLEDIDPDYVEWLKKENIAYDPENPIKDKRTT